MSTETSEARAERVHDHFGHDVTAGPDCKCGHRRDQHVGSMPLPGGGPPFGFFDGPCQVDGCPCTPAGYIPVGDRTYAEIAPLYGPGWRP